MGLVIGIWPKREVKMAAKVVKDIAKVMEGG